MVGARVIVMVIPLSLIRRHSSLGSYLCTYIHMLSTMSMDTSFASVRHTDACYAPFANRAVGRCLPDGEYIS